MASITGMLPSDVIAIRDGQQVHLAAKELVTGDIVSRLCSHRTHSADIQVCVSLGNKLPADVRFVEVSSDMKLDRSVLTGEAEPITATVDSTDVNMLETKNIGLQGTLCVSGSGKGKQLSTKSVSQCTHSSGLVIQTGSQTVFGRIAKLSSKGAPAQTTLQREIRHFVSIIIVLALFFAVLVTTVWGAWLNRDHYGFITASGAVINFVAVCVAFVPEGMPASVTISLSVVANRLAKNKVLCKTLMTVETLGSVDVLCSDKTGTLTKNQMTVTNAAILDDEILAQEARDRIVRGGDQAENCRQIAAVAGVCNSAVFDESTMEQPIALRVINGDATGTSLYVSLNRCNMTDAA